MIGLIGKKIGMTRVFSEDGTSTPVTVIDISENTISQIKTNENDGYTAIQVAYGSKLFFKDGDNIDKGKKIAFCTTTTKNGFHLMSQKSLCFSLCSTV